MLFIIGFVLSLVVTAALYFIGPVFVTKREDEPAARRVGAMVGLGLTAVVVLVCSITVVPAGHKGVQVLFGETKQQVISEGLSLVNPASTVYDIDVRLARVNVKGSAGTKDIQEVHAELVVSYRLDPEKVSYVYQNYGIGGGRLTDNIIGPAVNESFKAVISKYDSEQLITKRGDVSAAIKDLIEAKLAKYSLHVSDVNMVDFAFNPDYQKAVESKVIATQTKLKADQDLERIKVEAQQEIEKAKGNAEAIRISAQAIQNQGGAQYVQLKAIEKWDGNLPNVMSGTVPFINVGR